MSTNSSSRGPVRHINLGKVLPSEILDNLNRQDREDLCQHILMLRRRRKYVTHHAAAVDWLRLRETQRRSDNRYGDEQRADRVQTGDQSGKDSLVAQVDAKVRLEDIFAKLSYAEAQILSLSKQPGMSVRKAAAELGIPYETARDQIASSLGKLR